MTQYYVFNYLNDYEEPISSDRLIQIIADFNRADGKSTIKLSNGVFLDSKRDGRFYDSTTGIAYAQAYSYNIDNICYNDHFVQIGY